MKSWDAFVLVGLVALAIITATACGSSESGGHESGGQPTGGTAGNGGTSNGGSHTGNGGAHAGSGGGGEAGAENAGDGGASGGAAGMPEAGGSAGKAGAAGTGGSGGAAGNGGAGFGGQSGFPGAAQHIDAANELNGVSPQIGVDDAGNAVATWLQTSGASPQYSIWSNRYVNASSSWASATRLDASDSTDVGAPQIAVGASGSAIVVWCKPAAAGKPLSMWARRFNGSVWSDAKLLEGDDTGQTVVPVVGMDDKGNAVALWAQSVTDGTYTVRSSSYSASKDTWSAPLQIETGHVGNSPPLRVSGSSVGDAVAIWVQNATGKPNAWASRLSAGATAWTTPVDLQSILTEAAILPVVSINSSGIAVAVWGQDNGTAYQVWSARSTGMTTWAGALKLQTGSVLSASPGDVSVDSKGNAITLWSDSSALVWSDRYAAASNAWLGDASIANANAEPHLAGNAAGQVAALWLGSGLVTGRTLSLGVAGSAWSSPVALQKDGMAPSERPQVGVNGKGIAFAVWDRNEAGRARVWASRFP